MDKTEKTLNIALVFFIGLLIFVIICAFMNNKAIHEAKDNACQRLGYEEYIHFGNGNDVLGFCEDNNGNLHYVKYEYNQNCCFW